MSGDDDSRFAPVDPVKTGLRGLCPRCGQGRLFSGMLSLAPRCNACGLNYAFADAGDGPAVFVILIVGFIIIGSVLWAEVTYSPPVWLLILLFGPLTVILCLLTLRWMKGLLIALQFRHKAQEGRLSE